MSSNSGNEDIQDLEARHDALVLNEQAHEEEDAGTDDDDDRRLLILYASQTGSAQDVAEYIGREAWRRHFKARVQDVHDFDKAGLLDSTPTIIITSTTGQGHFPTSILPLWNFLIRSDLPEDLLQDFNYALFGLGDSTYPKFNWPVRKLKRRLDMLGANELIEKGEADDQHYLGIDGTLMPWLDNLWSTLLQHFPLPPHLHILPAHSRPPPRVSLTPIPVPSTSTSEPFIVPAGMVQATLTQNKRVTAEDHFQDTRHVILEFEQDLSYEAGDILELRPENLPEDVEQFLKVMKWTDQAEEVLEVKSVSRERPLPAHWPKQTTLRQLFTRYLDIFSVPRRSFFEWLSYFTTSELETEKLQEFCTAEGQDDMYSYANRPRRTIAEVLAEFKSAVIPLEYITDLFPEIRPRQFSIASSSKRNPRTVELLVAIVKYKTMLKTPRKGIATSWLAQLKPGQKVAVAFTSGSMRLPPNPSTPIILIGPGTGIAPFRAFVQDRLAPPKLNGHHANGHTRAGNNVNTLVFFGCRSKNSDFYFGKEWENLHTSGQITFDLAASRDQEDKVYVQHRILRQSKLVWEYLGRQNGILYISGSANQMPKAVQKSLKQVFQTEGGMSEEEAGAYFDRLEAEGRYQEETWS
ncbi:NADPH dependent diflavin oxidoreductase 1 [Cystobasidium minutum MCA 4210]|uniref:NADPH dependent diflavin oxidoreductase 1 n=1 Tax=Cystobasidium minutum MCA 4210 TaxID=1397322 RepID=UPI0034CEDCBE|eukprot:jgi/Rhomi1/184408/fgenesh1_pm.7_\